jgi:hypothetical protein
LNPLLDISSSDVSNDQRSDISDNDGRSPENSLENTGSRPENMSELDEFDVIYSQGIDKSFLKILMIYR